MRDPEIWEWSLSYLGLTGPFGTTVFVLDFCWTRPCPEALLYTSGGWLARPCHPASSVQPCCSICSLLIDLAPWRCSPPDAVGPHSRESRSSLLWPISLGWTRTWYGHTYFECTFGLLATSWEARATAGSVFTAVVLMYSSCLLAFATVVPVCVQAPVCSVRTHTFLFCLRVPLPDTLSSPHSAPSWLRNCQDSAARLAPWPGLF